MRRTLIGIITVLGMIVIPIAFGTGWYYVQLNQDVLQQINAPYSELSGELVDTGTAMNHEEARIYHDARLLGENSDTVSITVSLPITPNHGPIPVVIVLGGLEAGRKSLSYIPNHGNNALVSYQYPFKPSYFADGAYFTNFKHIRNSIIKTPAQMCMAMDWIHKQPWADPDRIVLLGYSLGAMALPAVQRLAQTKGYHIRATALCYGGVDYDELIHHNFKDRFPGVTPLTSRIGAALIRPMEPRMHIRHLEGEFLVVNGKLDTRIPFVKAQEFQALVPEPKTIINLDEGHMHPRKPELTKKLIKISRDWLLEKGAANP